jgi:hypothetical protein
MCQHCDSEANRASVRETLTRLETPEALIDRLLLFTFATTPDGEDRFTDPDEHGTVTLTKGQAMTLRSGLKYLIDSITGQALQAAEMAEHYGVPLEAVLTLSTVHETFECVADADEVLRKGAADAVEIFVPDDASALM